MIVKGIDGEPIHKRVRQLLEEHGVVYLHKSGGGLDGWIVSRREQPDDPFSPETITLRRCRWQCSRQAPPMSRKRSTPKGSLCPTREEIIAASTEDRELYVYFLAHVLELSDLALVSEADERAREIAAPMERK